MMPTPSGWRSFSSKRNYMEALEIVDVQCPYCGEWVELAVERAMAGETCGEDCPVCCRPMVIEVRIDDRSVLHVSARREND